MVVLSKGQETFFHFLKVGDFAELVTNTLTVDLLVWAAIIIVLEKNHSKHINEFTSNKFRNKIKILSIEDKYDYFQPELIDNLLVKATKYFSHSTLLLCYSETLQLNSIFAPSKI